MNLLTSKRMNDAKTLCRLAAYSYLYKIESESICEILEAYDNATNDEKFLQCLVVIVNTEFDEKLDFESSILHLIDLFTNYKEEYDAIEVIVDEKETEYFNVKITNFFLD